MSMADFGDSHRTQSERLHSDHSERGEAGIAPSRTQKRTIETRKKIFETAIQLFLKKGFADTTVADITTAADVGKGTFFAHFATKETVLAGIGEQIVGHVMDAVTRSRAKDAESLFRKIFLSAAVWHEENPELSQMYSQAVISNPDAFEADRTSQEQFFESLAGVVALGQGSGVFKKSLEPMVVAEAVSGAYFLSILRWHSSGRSVSLKKRLDQILDAFLMGLGT